MKESNTIISRKDQEETAKVISRFIASKVDESNTNGVVIGLSGGLDSSTTAFLCSKSLRNDQILGIIMPTVSTPNQDIEDGIAVAEMLGIEYEIIHVDNLIAPFNDICIHARGKDLTNTGNLELANANLKARIRMMMLYYHANILNRLVVGTGNRTELLVGYFTKFGDGGVDILPIGDLYKTDVRNLATHLRVPENIIKKAPTAGLWAGQTDEEELGMKYEVLDKLLQMRVDKRMDLVQIAEKLEIPVDEVLRIEMKVKNSEHKLKPAPLP